MVEILHPGSYSSIQDLGRWGVQKYGIPIGGAMDQFHAMLANELVGNEPDKALIECTWKGPDLHFHCAAQVAISGANYHPKINDKLVKINQRLSLQTGDVLQLGTPDRGWRGYIAVKGGFQIDPIMGSRSMYKALHGEATLKNGSVLPIKTIVENASSHSGIKDHFFEQEKTLSVLPGPEINMLNSEQRSRFFNTTFSLDSQSNRMAILLNGSNEIVTPEILTAPVQPGTIQLTPGGRCVILMRDAQTTGGYARIAQLTDHSMNVISQYCPGDFVRLQLG